MATVKTLLRKYQLLNTKLLVLSACSQQNAMSQYPKYYIKPIHKKEAQEELYKSGKAQKLAHVPTKAAPNDLTSSTFQDDLVNLFINYIMRDGLKTLARGLVERSFEKIKRVQLERYHKAQSEEDKQAIELNPRNIFHSAVINCKPLLQLAPIKRGGVTYQVPVPITNKRSQFLSMKWLIESARERNDRTKHFPDILAFELIDAANNTGKVVKKKQDLHRQCEANRAYAHYRWG